MVKIDFSKISRKEIEKKLAEHHEAIETLCAELRELKSALLALTRKEEPTINVYRVSNEGKPWKKISDQDTSTTTRLKSPLNE